MTDHWTERVHCAECHKVGVASLSQAKGEDMPTATVSDGFRVLKSEYGPTFQCNTCAARVEPFAA
jgi:hypothetical protein